MGANGKREGEAFTDEESNGTEPPSPVAKTMSVCYMDLITENC